MNERQNLQNIVVKIVIFRLSSHLKARSTLVTWAYSPELDELPIVLYILEYQNNTFKDDIALSGGLLSEDLVNLKPYTSYSVRMIATSVLGNGSWSNQTNFTTKTAGNDAQLPVNSRYSYL